MIVKFKQIELDNPKFISNTEECIKISLSDGVDLVKRNQYKKDRKMILEHILKNSKNW